MQRSHPQRLALIAFTTLLANAAIGQPYWSQDIGSVNNEHVSDVKVDNSGMLYVTGEFGGAVTIDGQGFAPAGSLDMFVAKFDAQGGLVWFKRCGGTGIDRGIKLDVDNAGHVAVVGEFMGAADFQGTVLNSMGGTPDMFVAVFNANNGNLQWIRQGGGADGSDRPYGVTISPNGNVTMCGEFRGDATFQGQALSSMIDPINLLPSVDVVIASYTSTGGNLWVQQGAAKHSDRAIDLVSDAQGNVYVCGQFSDTITFDQTHNNAMYNATFLIKLDAAGNEQWFRRCGGAVFDHVRDIQMDGNGDLVLCGDLQGNMIYLDSLPNMIQGQDPYAIYVMKVKTDGEMLNYAVSGSQELVSARSLIAFDDTVSVLGQFQCRFTDMSDLYGQGRFMATGDGDLFIARFMLGTLAFVDAQQFGGAGEKLAGQVAALPGGDLVFCGSYQTTLVFPASDALFSTSPLPIFFTASDLYQSMIYDCGDPWASYYAAQGSFGLKDGFLARGFVKGRSPYDMWARTDSSCTFPPGNLCASGNWIDACSDTVIACGVEQLHLRSDLRFTDAHTIALGPDVDILWSTGDTIMTTLVYSTGWYSVHVASINGCWQWTDSIYVIINPMPPHPHVSDDVVVNTNSDHPARIHLCDPDSAWIWCPNLDPSTTYWWMRLSNDTLLSAPVYSDSLSVDTTGLYVFTMVTDSGCTRMDTVEVIDHGNYTIPDLTANIQITFPQETMQNDTVWLCPTEDLVIVIDPHWSISGMPSALPFGLELFYRVNNSLWSQWTNTDQPIVTTALPSYGWNIYHIDLKVKNSPCGHDSLMFSAIDSVWVGIHPGIALSLTITGGTIMCMGDSTLLVADCPNCDAVIWSTYGGAISTVSDTSIYATWAGIYNAYGTAADAFGCVSHTDVDHEVIFPSVPLLYVDPLSGIICPNATATIWTDAIGTNQIWYGPLGPHPNDSMQTIVATPGEYYLTMTDQLGCHLTSDPILITGYATPFLNVTPDGILCLNDPNDNVTLQVVTTGYDSFVWAAPLSGNSLIQIVDQPGTYSCTVEACGIITQLSVTIVYGQADAQVLTPGPYTICAGDTVLLEGASGQAIYMWDPGQVYAQTFAATQSGSYTLTVYDSNGCTDQSAPVIVDVLQFPQPAIAVDVGICIGDTAFLVASGSNTLTWFSDAALQNVIGTGTQLVMPDPTASTTVYVVQSDSTCTGPAIPVEVTVTPLPVAPVIDAPLAACVGDAIVLTASSDSSATYLWSTPGGSASGSQVTIDPVSVTDAGTYICTAFHGLCASASDSAVLVVHQPVPLFIGNDTTICPGGTATFFVPAEFTSPQWSDGSSAQQFTTQLGGTIILTVNDTNGCASIDQALVTVLQFTLPLSVNGDSICLGADALLGASGSGTITWYLDPLLDSLVNTGGGFTIGTPQGSDTYYVTQTENGCVSDPQPVMLIVAPAPVDVSITAPAALCIGTSLTITLQGTPGLDATWTTPLGAMSGTTLIIAPFTLADTGLYTASTFIGPCTGDTISAIIAAFIPQPFSLGPDTTFCEGGTITLQVPGNYGDPEWTPGSAAYNITIGTVGTYIASAFDANNCAVADTINVSLGDCPPVFPNLITPNGDGVNDTWVLDQRGFIGAELFVFDRFGDEVYHNDPVRKPFAGINEKSGKQLADGVYYYVLSLEHFDGTFSEHKGYMHLSR